MHSAFEKVEALVEDEDGEENRRSREFDSADEDGAAFANPVADGADMNATET